MALSPRFSTFLVVLTACVAGAGCSDDSSPSDEEALPGCGLEVDLAGGVMGSYGMGQQMACASPFAFDAGMRMIFLPGDDIVGGVSFDVGDVRAGEVGTFPTTAEVTSPDAAIRWATADCTVEITEHERVAEHEMTIEYLVVGTGTCTAPAEAVAGSGEPVTFGDFAFRFPAEWGK